MWDLLIIWSYIFDKVFLCPWISQKLNLNSYFHFQNSWALDLGTDVGSWITIGNHFIIKGSTNLTQWFPAWFLWLHLHFHRWWCPWSELIQNSWKFCGWFKTAIFHLKPINPPLEVYYLGPQLVRILSGIAKALHVLPNENGPLTRLIQKPCPTYTAEQTKSHVLRKNSFLNSSLLRLLLTGCAGALKILASGTNVVIKYEIIAGLGGGRRQ